MNPSVLQNPDRHQSMVDRAEPVAGYDDHFTSEPGNQIGDGVTLAKGDEQAAGTFDQETFAPFRNPVNLLQNLRQADAAMVLSRSEKRRHRLSGSGVARHRSQWRTLRCC